MRRVSLSVALALSGALTAFLVSSCSDNGLEPNRTGAPAHIPIALATASTGSGAIFTTDKDDYLPGDTLKLAGSGWQAGDVLDIHLDESPQNHPPVDWTVQVDASGSFRDSSYVVQDSDLGVTFALTATSRATGETATATFTDAAPTNVSYTLNGTTFTFPTPPPANQNSTNPISVSSGATVTINVTATTVTGVPGGANWQSTGVSLRVNGGASFGTEICDNTVVVSNNTAQTTSRQFTFSAPSPAATTLYDVRVRAYIGTGCSGTSGVTPVAREFGVLNVLVVTNHTPTADAGDSYTGNEGSAISISGTASDADNDPLTTTWTVNDGGYGKTICTIADPSSLSTTVTCTDNGTFTLTLSVTDGKIVTPVTSTATLTVSNVAPSVSITTPTSYYVLAITSSEFNSNGFVTASFTDAGKNDTHKCQIDWGNGAGYGPEFNATETAGSGSGSCTSTAGNPYTAYGAGIYTITVKVTDDDTGEGTATVTIVVYDPSAGFVTGGGWIMSPAGAYVADGSLSGRANFGFVSKYQKGATVPTGNTEFQFQAGNLNFHSESYDWLVVNQNGVNAQYKGTGTINGASCSADREGKCRFMLWANDGTKTGGFDSFEIKIWTEDNDLAHTPHTIYDNGTQQQIAGGSIQVQTGKK